jgi:hypothetical protein
MRGATQRDLRVGKAISVGGAGLDQRQRLQRLYRRSRKHRPLDVAEGQNFAAVGVDDDPRATVKLLDARASRDLNHDGVGHDGSDG